MARTEETILEPPITPAPVFAYRALRSIFFNSPDDSPVAEQQQHVLERVGTTNHRRGNSNSISEKENLLPEFRFSSPVKSPSRFTSKRVGAGQDATTANNNDCNTSSPLKRKRENAMMLSAGAVGSLSPTKSILRTPGLPTPRAKSLRDVNVKFKSVSPELRMKDVLARSKKDDMKHGGLLEVKDNITTAATKTTTMTTTLTASEQQSLTKQNSVLQGTHARTMTETTTNLNDDSTDSIVAPAVEEEILAYMRRTEKEMKKLVRYGQKMREFAQRTDAENVKLRRLLEETKMENERLKKVVDRSEIGREKGYLAVTATADEDILKPSNKQITSSFGHPSSKVNSNRDARDAIVAGFADQKRNAKQEARLSLPDATVVPAQVGKKIAPQRTVVPGHDKSKPQQPEPVSKTRPIDVAFRTIERSASTSVPPAFGIGTSGPSTSVATSDRLAAARERVRQKAQLRKASADIGDSQVDWAGL